MSDNNDDTAGASPSTKDFDNISDMEISDKEDDKPRRKIVAHGMDSDSDSGFANKGAASADKDDPDSDLTDIEDLEDELDDLADIDEDLAAARDRPEVDLDQDAVMKMGVHRRARGEAAGGQKKKKEVSRRSRKARDDTRGEETESGEKAAKPKRPLTEAELKLKELDSKIEKATKAPGRKRKPDGDSTYYDEVVAELKNRMKMAAKHDADDKDAGRPATRKLKMLPEVLSAFRQKELRQSIADSNLLEAVRFWLEPLPDKSLPAYDIQRDLFQMLLDMPEIDYDMLRLSGLGKLLNFYIRDARPQQHIRLTAQKLYENWSRPILEKSSNYRDRKIETADYDQTVKRVKPKLSSFREKPDALAPPQLKTNRTRVPDATPQTYTIAPRSKVVTAVNPAAARPLGASAEDSIRRLKARASGKIGGRGGGKANA
ncbi:Transcription factor iws1 [Orbilia brochopaga]|uniref:Transcription factor iws1 n=1 Tax=Orbilia brochopaga TaxID=3140254 RepID=A0AAV9UFW5_9PEZI